MLADAGLVYQEVGHSVSRLSLRTIAFRIHAQEDNRCEPSCSLHW